MRQPKRLVYIISDVHKALAFEWTTSYLKEKYKLYFIIIGEQNTEMAKYLSRSQVQYFEVSTPEFSSTVSMWCKVVRILLSIRPDIVHTHLWRANLLGLTAAWILNIKKRVFTRHHAMVHYNEHPGGRKWDRLCNFVATDIIAVSENVKNILIGLDGASPAKIHLLHHGFDLTYFERAASHSRSSFLVKYDIRNSKKPIVGVIARYTEWKGIQYVIQAFREVLKLYPEAHLVLANAHGGYKPYLRQLLSTIPDNAYTEVLYEEDLAMLYQSFDVYVHVPVDKNSEAFGQTYVEALAAGIPSVFTLSGVAREFVRDRYNALVVDFRNADQITEAIHAILSNEKLRKQLIASGRESVKQFDMDTMFRNLQELYG